MYRIKPTAVLLSCILLTVLISLIKYWYPDYSFFNSGFVFVILLTIFLPQDYYTKAFAALTSGIILVTMHLSGQDTGQKMVLHLLTVGVILLAMAVVLYIKRLYKSIDKEKRYLNALFEHATEGVILTNKEGRIVLINPAALKLFGYGEKELLGERVEKLIPMRFATNHQTYREKFYDAPANRTMGHGRDLFGLRKEGDEFPVEVSLSYFKQNDDFFVIAFLVDITQRKESERRLIEQKEELEKITRVIKKLNAELENKVEERTMILREALQELERSQSELSEALDKEKELSEIKSRFVSMASHEFRTPLSTVLSSASLLSKYTTSDEQARRDKHIRRIKDSVKHLNDLLEDFLSLGKLEEGKVSRKVERFVVKDLLEETTDDIKGIFKDGQYLQHHLQDTSVFTTDRKLLKNILINIISNAVKFSPEGATIDLFARQENGRLKIAVRDKGIGISEEDQQHLFSSFFRAKNAINIQGTGLGLHIVKRYVDLIDGDISLQSQLDHGTTVSIDLPELAASEEA